MLDQFNRPIYYLRISVTDKCNLRCTYCMPSDGVPLMRHEDILSYEDIHKIVSAAAELGFTKIRLTGGEPLVRRDIELLVKMISRIEGIDYLGMTTNGVLLAEKENLLWDAGLRNLNISLDTLDTRHYKELTRGGELKTVLNGINKAASRGFNIKINSVVLKDSPGQDLDKIKKFCTSSRFKFQLINHFSLQQEKSTKVKYDRPPDCSKCNRIRLLADGNLKSCLHSDGEKKIDLSNIKKSLKELIYFKPAAGSTCSNRQLQEIGG